ncbi:helix-turn-helix domain-containing protein [Acidiferrimicrobium sp. IK]|uniref:helix-turn-helix domain-containing protein n=1 Tax=Acidiferrimicrobium sp. IK TaxID=2871700 RepID=UPI0021CB0396|nr:helix-turn-helix transcriptional regulator [Acidiferrimicrobium sp. IK]MCU4186619.1 helix-turn-helix domain-containing protein [Acidiferrimicrobium sp. IK]
MPALPVGRDDAAADLMKDDPRSQGDIRPAGADLQRRIRDARTAAGLSIADAAAAAQISRHHWSAAERGRAVVSVATAEAMASAIGLDAESTAAFVALSSPDHGRSNPWRQGRPYGRTAQRCR